MCIILSTATFKFFILPCLDFNAFRFKIIIWEKINSHLIAGHKRFYMIAQRCNLEALSVIMKRDVFKIKDTIVKI